MFVLIQNFVSMRKEKVLPDDISKHCVKTKLFPFIFSYL